MFPLHDNLYHYTKYDTALNFILPTMKIMMGSFNNVNDPRESKIWPFTLYSKNLKTNENFDSKVFQDISKFITHKSLMLCLTRDDPTLASDNEDDKDIRVGYAHARMWAQYGDNHKGVCFVFDKAQLNASIESVTGKFGLFHGPINYRSSARNPNGDAFHLAYLEDILDPRMFGLLEQHITKHHQALFFNKHIDWRDEWEYRWVFRSENENPIFIPIDKCIKALILGNDCTIDASVEDYFMKIRIPLYRMHQHGWALSLLPEDSREDIISLNGISFSTEIPCSGVFVQARDNRQRNRTLRVDTNGNMVLLE